jgi:subtilase family serine protease
MRTRTPIAVVAGVSTLIAATLVAASASGSPAGRSAPTLMIANTRPAWTAGAADLGRAMPSATVHARIYLAPRAGMSALTRRAMAISTPGNAQYGHFLTPAQYYAQFAPTPATVAAVRSWVTGAGMRVARVAPHNDYLAITGPVAAAERTFGTRLERYRADGTISRAPVGAARVPAELAGAVLTVLGLDTRPVMAQPQHIADAPPPGGFRNARPCSNFFGQLTAKFTANFKTKLPKFHDKYLPYAPCGYTGPQFRSAYEHNSRFDGTGITVGITDAFAAPTIKFDINHYAREHGDGAYAPGQYTQWKPKKFTRQKACGASGWYGEQTLDVEAVHAMAPGAHIRYYAQASCTDAAGLDTFDKLLDQNRVQLVSNSWGYPGEVLPTNTIAAYNKIFLRGATQGISFMFSSGDDGDELANTGLKQPDDLGTNPYVTAVGGTATAIGGNGMIKYATAWGTKEFTLGKRGRAWVGQGFLYGAGGGSSNEWNKPAYQRGHAPGTTRQVPDVAMDADPQTGMLVGETQRFPHGVHYGEYRIGGTSLASPLFAGMTAVAFEKSHVKRVGLLNPTLYRHAGRRAFNDIKGTPPNRGVVRCDFVNGINRGAGLAYTVRTFNNDSSLRVHKGWDHVTGLGTARPGYLSIFRR